MAARRWSELSWTEVRDLGKETATPVVAVLPVGAVEAHGPHLPLATDGVIAEAMAREGARRLERRGWTALVLPALDYTAAPFAAEFPGTVSLRPETVTAVVTDIARSLGRAGIGWLAIANAHLDPTHLASLRAAADAVAEAGPAAALRVVFPDVTRKPWALWLTEEFRSGACHAGQYESSIVLAERPDLVRPGREELPPNPVSLVPAIQAGKATFAEAGGPEAYFGDPAAASAAEGRETVAVLGRILEEAVLEAAGQTGAGPTET